LNYGSEPADQVVRYTLEGAEVALKLSGLAAKNFAVFAYAVLKDQKKNKGKTRLVRMLKEQRPLKFFTVPSGQMRQFSQEAKKRGLLFVPIRNKQNPGEIELVVFADDAAKVNRVMDRLNLDFVKSQAGEAQVEQSRESVKPAPVRAESVAMEGGPVEFEVGGMEEEFSVPARQEPAENFTPEEPEKNPSGSSSPSRNESPGSKSPKPSVKQELREIRREQAEKAKSQPVPPKSRSKTKQKAKRR